MDFKQEATEILVTHKAGILYAFIGMILLLSVILWVGSKYHNSSPVGAPETPIERKIAGKTYE